MLIYAHYWQHMIIYFAYIQRLLMLKYLIRLRAYFHDGRTIFKHVNARHLHLQ